jgi:hypothetical protein
MLRGEMHEAACIPTDWRASGSGGTLARTTIMNLTPEEVKEFQTIIREEYGRELSEGEATVIAKRLLLLYELIYRPLPSEFQSGKPSEQPALPSPADGPSQAAP